MLSLKSIPIVAGLAAMGLLFGTRDAAAYNITSCEVPIGCPSGGNITVTDIAGGVDVLVSLAANEVFAQTGAGGGAAVLFDLAGNPTITVTTVTANLIKADGSSAGSDTFQISNSGSASNIHADGTGHWEYGVESTLSGGGTSPPFLVSPIEFQLFGSGLSSASFELNDNQLLFALDVGVCTGTGTCGTSSNPVQSTGLVDVVPAPPIGHGVSVMLAIGGLLFGAKLWGRSNKRSMLPRHAAA